MSATRYPFRSESTESVVWVSFETMMRADCMGIVEIDGKSYRRARDLEGMWAKPAAKGNNAPKKGVVSDAAGFLQSQLPEMEAARKSSGCRGIEFKPDPTVPGFMQVHAASRTAFQRYIRTRGMIDKTSRNGSGAMVSAHDIANATALTRRVYL